MDIYNCINRMVNTTLTYVTYTQAHTCLLLASINTACVNFNVTLSLHVSKTGMFNKHRMMKQTRVIISDNAN